MRLRRTRRVLRNAAVVCLGLSLAACAADAGAGDTDRNGHDLSTGFVNVRETGAEARSGGTLRLSETYPLVSLDPTVMTGASTGGMEGAAVFDQLIRYDADTDTYLPQLAQSLTSNDSFTEWTLRLRPGVTFTDGTPLDADAVVFNLERYAATPSAVQSALVKMITRFDTPDANTVVMSLDRAWARFPGLLASNAGMIGSPKAIQEDPKVFGQKPVGAGPFVVTSFVQREKLEYTRNQSYWAGPPKLDGINVTFNTDALASVDRLSTGDVDMAKVGGDKPTATAQNAGLSGYVWAGNGWGFLLNDNPAGGSPTADPRVRRAMAAAVNLDDLAARVSGGAGRFHSSLFPDGSPWSDGTPGPAYDPDLARRLVEEVKAEKKWDGRIELTATGDPTVGVAIQAMLNAVGFDLVIDTVPSFSDVVNRVYAQRKFQMTQWGIAMYDDDPWASLYPNFYGGSSGNGAGYDNPALDGLLDRLGGAPTRDEARPILGEIQMVFTDEVPMLITGAYTYSTFWSDKVHGLVPTSRSVLLLDQAFLANS